MSKTKRRKKTRRLNGRSRQRHRHLHHWERPITFSEDFGWREGITFDAASYTRWMENALPIIKSMKPITSHQAMKRGKRVGNKIFYLRPLPMIEDGERRGLAIYDNRSGLLLRNQITVYFSDVVNIPILADSEFDPWMSLTPNEVYTLRDSFNQANGNVAMAGLGLGWAARKVLQRRQVEKLTIFDIDPHVIRFFGKSLLKDFGSRVEIINESAYEVDWSQYDVALWDIWQGFGEAQDDEQFLALKRQAQSKGKVFLGWGE